MNLKTLLPTRPLPGLVDAATRLKRLEICRACPERQFRTIAKIEVCGKCGCPIVSKTRFAQAKCPLNKW